MLTLLTSSTLLAALLAGPPQDDVARHANLALSLERSQVLPVLLDGELGGALRATRGS